MSSKEMVLGAVSQLPDDASLEEIAREIEFLRGIEVARAQARRGETISAEELLKEMDTWDSP